MRKPTKICLALLLVLGILLSVASVRATEPTDPGTSAPAGIEVTSGCSTIDAEIPLVSGKKILDTARSALLYDMTTDTLVYTLNPDRRIYPGGLAKIMTVLVALEHGNLTDEIIVTRAALDLLPSGTVVCNLKAGEKISLRDLLYCVMVASANDASIVVAQHISGTQEAFVELMNQKAAALGCTGTNFANTTGLHHEDEYTTARDLGKMILAGLEQEQFAEMFRASSYTVPATNKSEARTLNTTNYMMSKAVLRRYFDERVTGGKTGASNEGRSLAVTAEVGNTNLLAIVLDAVPVLDANGISMSYYGNFEEAKVLLDYGFSNFRSFGLLNPDQTLLQFPVTGGQNHVVAGATAVLGVTLPKDVDTTEFTWRYTLKDGIIHAPVRKGDIIGTAQIWYYSMCIGQTELVAVNDVLPVTDFSDPGIDPSKQMFLFSLENVLNVVGILAGVVLILAGSLFMVRTVRVITVQSRRRRRRLSRRRSRT